MSILTATSETFQAKGLVTGALPAENMQAHMRILVIEDETKVAQALPEGLAGEHYEVAVAKTGEEGFFRANAEVFDLIVLDLMLPGRDGIEEEVYFESRRRGHRQTTRRRHVVTNQGGRKMHHLTRLTRREAMRTMITGSLAATLLDFTQGGQVMSEGAQQSGSTTPQLPLAYRGEHQVKPLPFDAAKLKGLSEKLISSHHQNNYSGAVRRLNQIQQQIGSLPKDAAPYQMGSLKREELIATNSMIQHEFYFGNLGGDGKASGTIVDLLKTQYGTFEAWEHDFRLIGMSLAGGSGWVILNYNLRENTVHNYWAWDHTHSLAWGVPLLVMDMYEHSYHMDYGANARGYIDAFFQNINWDEVNRRAEAARSRK